MSSRVLITGGSGFAGGHLAEACVAAGDEVVGLSRAGGGPGGRGLAVDLHDPAAVRAAVAELRPEHVYHLAALASVGRSWEDPRSVLEANVRTTLNLLEAVRDEAPGARVVLAGTGEVYGPPPELPVDEGAALRPQNPYAVSKASADLLAGFFADAHGLHVVRARPFNHAGPRQHPMYAIASFARQVAAGRLAGERPVRVVTGNPDARRDFTDVRDVARAYRELAAGAPPGIYNICSGRSVAVRELVAALGRGAGVEVEHEVDPALVRAHEVMEVRGSHARLTEATGWEPEIALEQTLGDTVAWWETQLTRE